MLTWDPTRAFWKALRTRLVLHTTKLSTALNSECKESTAFTTSTVRKGNNQYSFPIHKNFPHVNQTPLPHQIFFSKKKKQ